MSLLAGKTALITGGGRGIGAAAAHELAKAGATVAVVARNEAQVVDVAGRLRDRGYEAFAFRCDVTDQQVVRDVVLSATEAMGQIDILVNNAGTATSNAITQITLQEWEHIMAVNATGTFLCTQAVLEHMMGLGWGRIVNVASIAGLEGGRYIAAYTAAKHAVIGFTKCAAIEAKGRGITVNAVCPGYVDTPLTDETIARIMRRTSMSWHEAMEAILEQSGQARLIRAEEVAQVILNLCGPDADGTTGEAIVLDGKDTP